MSELTWKARDKVVKAIKVPTTKTKVPLIVRPLKLPRHTYTQANFILYTSELKNTVYYHSFSKLKRWALLKRSMDISL